MSLKLTAGSSVELQGSGDLMHHGQRGREGGGGRDCKCNNDTGIVWEPA